jgi:hypothetical protein
MTQQEAQEILNSQPAKNQSMTPEMASQILSQNPVAAQSSENEMSWPESLARHVGAGVTKWGQNLANLPNNWSGGIIPEFSPKSFDPYKAFGVEENLADKIGVGLLDFAPFSRAGNMIGASLKGVRGSPMLKANLIGGGLYGASSNEDDRLLGAATGTALGGAAHGLGVLGGKALEGIGNAYAKSSIPALVEKATQYVKEGLGPSESGAKALKGAYDTQVGKTNALWKSAEEQAAALDNSNMRIDPSAYNKTVENFIKEKSALEPAKGAKYSDALEFAKEEAKNLAPQSFSGVIALRQNLNELLGNFARKRNLDAPSREMKEFAKDLKFSLNDVVGAEGKSATPQVNDFYKTWTDANKATTRLKEFYQSPDKYGKPQPSRPLEGGLKGDIPEGSLMNEYLPGAGQTGTHGSQYLSGLLGDSRAAAEGLRNYEFRNVGRGKDAKDAFDFYQSMSPAQREVMFGGKPEEPLLSAAQSAAEKYYKTGYSNDKSLGKAIRNAALYHGLPGVVGFGASYGHGASPGQAALIGLGLAAGSKGVGSMIGRYAQRHPDSVLRAMNSKGNQKPGEYLNPLFNATLGNPE